MAQTAQKRALQNYRHRLRARGVGRFDVLGLDSDRGLLRSLAKRLAENDAEAARIRALVSQTIAQPAPAKGGVWNALRRSPLVGANLDLKRPRVPGRKIEL
jgi:hypothetical protein